MIRYMLILALLTLTGCTNTPVYVTPVPLPPLTCKYAPPPPVEVWLQSTDVERTQHVSKLYIRQLQYTRECQDASNLIK